MRTRAIQEEKRDLMLIDPALEKYLSSVATMSLSTADTYRWRLYPFVRYVQEKDKCTITELIGEIKSGKRDIYSLLGDYAAHLQREAVKTGTGAASIKRRVNVVKLALLFNDCEINEMKFKTKVRLPKTIRRDKEPLDKEDVRKILLASTDNRVKTYLMLLACTGMRAKEALFLRFSDFDLDANPPRVSIRGEITKTKTDRYVFLTQEFVKQFKDYIAWRHRERRISYYSGADGTRHNESVNFKPEYRKTDLVFTIPHRNARNNAGVESIYRDIIRQINASIDRIGLGEREQHSKFRKITRHSFRRFVKSTISDLGYGDYSEWYIGHAGSTYYRKKEAEKAEVFRKIEQYLTFLDTAALEQTHADSDSKIEALQDQMIRMQREHKAEMDAIMEAIRANQSLANVKPGVLVDKLRKEV